MTYGSVHRRLDRRYGKPHTHLCKCGKPAEDWAFQYVGEPVLYDEHGHPYVDDDASYTPMCKSCHQVFDLEKDPKYAAIMRDVGKRLGTLTAEKWKNDPAWAEQMRAKLRIGIKKAHAATAAMDPKKVSADRAKAARVANAIRRKCNDCELTTMPAAMGRHLSGSGHSGYTQL